MSSSTRPARPTRSPWLKPCRVLPAETWESLLPFVVRLLTEPDPSVWLEDCYRGLSTNIQEDREVALVAAMALHSSLVHPRWKENVHFWCDAIRRTVSNLHRLYERIPPALQDNPYILSAVAQHPCIDKLCFEYDSMTRRLFDSLLGRVCNRQSLRECVRYAKAKEMFSNPNLWRQIPQALWEDKELCLELLPWMPSLYGCLADLLRAPIATLWWRS